MASERPRLIVLTGPPGSGKSTLSRQLGDALGLPVLSRDALKEARVAREGRSHDALPPEVNAEVTRQFFAEVRQTVRAGRDLVIEAAFQHPLWADGLDGLDADLLVLICTAPPDVLARRLRDRSARDPGHAYAHGTSAHAASDYRPPDLGCPTVRLDTDRAPETVLADALGRVRCTWPRSGRSNPDPDSSGASPGTPD